jgi:hypothetical protein
MLSIDQVKRLNQSIAVEQRHLNELRKYLTMRRAVYQKNKGRYSYIDRLLEYNQYLKSLERLYMQMKERSLSLVQIQRLANVPNASSFVKTTNIR